MIGNRSASGALGAASIRELGCRLSENCRGPLLAGSFKHFCLKTSANASVSILGTSKNHCHTGEGRYPSFVIR